MDTPQAVLVGHRHRDMQGYAYKIHATWSEQSTRCISEEQNSGSERKVIGAAGPPLAPKRSAKPPGENLAFLLF